MQKFHLSSEIQPSEVGVNVFWTNCEDFFGQNHQKMLETNRFWELGDPGGIVFVRRNRLDNYAVTKNFYRCENTIPAPENSDFDQL